MLYPPKKRAYSPEPKKTKDLANLVNINSKFTGSGGSKQYYKIDCSSLAPKKQMSVPKPAVSGIFKAEKYSLLDVEKCCMNRRYSGNIMNVVIFQSLSASMGLSER